MDWTAEKKMEMEKAGAQLMEDILRPMRASSPHLEISFRLEARKFWGRLRWKFLQLPGIFVRIGVADFGDSSFNDVHRYIRAAVQNELAKDPYLKGIGCLLKWRLDGRKGKRGQEGRR